MNCPGMSQLQVALVGCGIISEQHIRAYARHADRARIVVCCDVDRDKATQRAAQIGEGTRVVTTLEEVLADETVDAVEICTPHHLHTDAVLAAARAGKHILCQKPLAKTLAECDAMIAAADAAGVTLFYAEMNRTLPAAILAREATEAGRIGQLIGVQATGAYWQGGKYLSTAWRYDPAVSGGGQLLDGGIHSIDLLLQIGGPIAAVSCFTTRFRPELGGEDTAALSLRFRDGHLGTLFSSQAAGVAFPGARFAAFGTEGTLTLGGPHGALALHRHDLPDRQETLLERNGEAFEVMIGRYLDTVVDGQPNPSPGTVGRANLEVVLAAYTSAERKTEVPLPLPTTDH
jgi:predicted dehydrogenase